MTTDTITERAVQSVTGQKKTVFENKPIKEWNPNKRWNPFNSYKLLAHVERWRYIRRGRPIPAPVLITVDPTNMCNLNCTWCNAAFIRKQRHRSLSENALTAIADFLPRWSDNCKSWEPGVKAICIAGGGEPLLNPDTAGFIDKVTGRGIEAGVVTNGVLINKYIDPLSQATWVGVSVDAGSARTFNKNKGMPDDSDCFDRIIDNIQKLTDYSRRHNYKLGWKHPAYGVSFKYLLYKENVHEIYKAARLAKDIGCKNIHFRPAGTTWDKIGTPDEIKFSDEEIAVFKDQVVKALELDDKNFGVYGVTHKFNSQFEASNCFDKCYAIFMTAVIMPPAGSETPDDSFVVGLCCDRRGDHKLELARNITDPNEINSLWGSEIHWQMHDRILIQRECPRCTYQPHNEIYEQVILNDSMTHKFI